MPAPMACPPKGCSSNSRSPCCVIRWELDHGRLAGMRTDAGGAACMSCMTLPSQLPAHAPITIASTRASARRGTSASAGVPDMHLRACTVRLR